jgi:hypothetical protein
VITHSAVAAALAASLIVAPAAPVPLGDDGLRPILQRLDRVASLYRDNALRFTCEETLTHFTGRGQRRYRFHYIFVYDEENRLADYRLKRQAAKPRRSAKKAMKSSEPVSLDRYTRRAGMPPPVLRAYNWVYLFERARWRYYEYRLLQRREVLERPALGIEFEPVPPYRAGVNEWFGRIWVDTETYQVLKVEALQPAEYLKKRRFEDFVTEPPDSTRKLRSTHVFSEVHTEYGVEVNGMRFPSEVVTRGVRYEAWAHEGDSGYREYPMFRLEQAYDNYRFFGVRAEEEIDRIVSPSR